MKAFLGSLAYLIPQVLRSLARGPQTVAYPFEPAHLPEGYRGPVQARADLCRGCGLCVRDCPAAALALQREDQDHFTLVYYPHRCAYCGQCELSCHAGVLYHDNSFLGGVEHLDTLVTALVVRTGR